MLFDEFCAWCAVSAAIWKAATPAPLTMALPAGAAPRRGPGGVGGAASGCGCPGAACGPAACWRRVAESGRRRCVGAGKASDV